MSRIQFTERNLWPVVTIALCLAIALGAAAGFIQLRSAANETPQQVERHKSSPYDYYVPEAIRERNKAYGAKLPSIE